MIPILVDTRESKILNLLPENIVKVEELEWGDFQVGHHYFERKTVSDFIASIESKRILHQLPHPKEGKYYMILEGNPLSLPKRRQDLLFNFIRALPKYDIHLLISRSPEDTVNHLLYYSRGTHRLQAPVKKAGRDIRMERASMFGVIRGIGMKTALKLIDRFGSPVNVIGASDEALLKVLNRTQLKRFNLITGRSEDAI